MERREIRRAIKRNDEITASCLGMIAKIVGQECVTYTPKARDGQPPCEE